jgi:hypothetical protein
MPVPFLLGALAALCGCASLAEDHLTPRPRVARFVPNLVSIRRGTPVHPLFTFWTTVFHR